MIPQKPRKRVTLSCGREELLYDIKQICYVSGDVLQDEMQDAKHQIQDVVEDGNVDLITRRLDEVHAEIEDIFCNDNNEYIEDGIKVDDKMGESSSYEITLCMDESTRISAVKLLQKYYHSLMVARVVMWWFMLVHPDEKKLEPWVMRCESLESSMKNIVNRIPKNLMIHPHPY